MAPLFSPRISPGLNFSSKTYYKVLHKSFNLWLLTTFNFYIGFCDFLHIWLLERQKINSLMKFSKLFWSKHLDSLSHAASDKPQEKYPGAPPSLPLCICSQLLRWAESPERSLGMSPCNYSAASWLPLSGICPDTDQCVVLLRVNWDQSNQHKTTDPKLILTIGPSRQHLQIVSKILISTIIPLIPTLALNFKMFPML